MSHTLSPSDRSKIIRAAPSVGVFSSRDLATGTGLNLVDVEAFLSTGVRHKLFVPAQQEQVSGLSYSLAPGVKGLLEVEVTPASAVRKEEGSYSTVDLLHAVREEALTYSSEKREWDLSEWEFLKKDYGVYKDTALMAVRALAIHGDPADFEAQLQNVESLICEIEATLSKTDAIRRRKWMNELDAKTNKGVSAGVDFLVDEFGSWAHSTKDPSPSDPYVFILDALQDGLSERLAESIRAVNAQVARFPLGSMGDEQREWLYSAVDGFRDDLDARVVFALDSDRHQDDVTNWASEMFRLTLPSVASSASGSQLSVFHHKHSPIYHGKMSPALFQADDRMLLFHTPAHRSWHVFCLDRGHRSAAIAEVFRDSQTLYLSNVQDDDVDTISQRIFDGSAINAA